MNEIKVSVSIVLQGRTLLTQEVANTLEQQKIGSGFQSHTQILKGKKGEITKISYKTRKCETIRQSIKINKAAYQAFISPKECPSFVKPGQWSQMSQKQRLEANLQRLCEGLQGLSYTYEVFED